MTIPAPRTTVAPAPVTFVVSCGTSAEEAAATVLSVLEGVSSRPDIDPFLVLVSADASVARIVLEPVEGDVVWVPRRTDAPVRGHVVDLRSGDVLDTAAIGEPRRVSPLPLPRGSDELSARRASPAAVSAPATGIPKVFHRVWLGPDPIPARYEAYWESWKKHHPTWDFVTWRDDDLPRLTNASEFDAASSWAGKADIARYEILLRHGGVYVDCDFECLKPIDGLLHGCSAFSASEDNFWVSIGIMGGVPGHPWFWALTDEVSVSVRTLPTAPTNEQTGPVMATRTVERMADGLQPWVFESSLFYPYGYGEPERAGGPFPNAYGVHHWGASWV